MKVSILLPSYAEEPVGGFRIAYGYAAGLARRGHSVTLLHPGALKRPTSLAERLDRTRWWVRRHIRQKPLAPWFRFPAGVKFRIVPWYEADRLPVADATIATAWETAEIVARAPSRIGKRFYLIQHFEDWSGSAERVRATYRLPLGKLAIARWLVDLVQREGETAVFLPNPLDLSNFSIEIPPERRHPSSILMMTHELEWKGTKEGLEALELLRERIPDVRVVLFGTHPIRNLPSWVDFVLAPHGEVLRRLYNEAAIFLAPSWSEGWGLTPCEAMACGSAVVATDIDGHREFARDGLNCLLVPARDPRAMADAMERLVLDERLRLDLAKGAGATLESFTGSHSLDRLEQILMEGANG
ncbi:MAG: glycosyltransferase family 4 protein [Fibrobacteria bacterium]|nr:glycosyltransferase family 4 protein [Fibrobacteria bacterium]